MISSSAQVGKFVISLCSVAVPIAIPQPRSPQLLRYRFFLHTSWEEGGRRHQLYMGYFATRDEAAKWLTTLRKIYPSAYVVVAPEAMKLTNTQIVSLLEQPASVSMQGAARVGETASARRGPPSGEATGNRPALQAREATGNRPGLQAREATGSRPALQAREATGNRPGLQAREATGSRPALRAREDRDRGRSSGPSLEDTIAALKVNTLDLNDGADPVSSTGVRHLRIEVQKQAPHTRGEKRSGSRKS
jgi:hypothetical protein